MSGKLYCCRCCFSPASTGNAKGSYTGEAVAVAVSVKYAVNTDSLTGSLQGKAEWQLLPAGIRQEFNWMVSTAVVGSF